MPIEVVYASEFYRAARKLQKRYPHVMDDAESLADELETGATPGDRLQGFDRDVYKVRLKNSDVQRGKSGGYRVIYYLRTEPQVVILLIYSKSDQSDIAADIGYPSAVYSGIRGRKSTRAVVGLRVKVSYA